MKKLFIILELLYRSLSFSVSLPSGKYLLNFTADSQFMGYSAREPNYYELIINYSNSQWKLKKENNSILVLTKGKFFLKDNEINFVSTKHKQQFNIILKDDKFLLINTKNNLSLIPVDLSTDPENSLQKKKISFRSSTQIFPIFSEEKLDCQNKNFQRVPLKEEAHTSQNLSISKINLERNFSLSSFYRYAIPRIDKLFNPIYMDESILDYFIKSTDESSYIDKLNLKKLYQNNNTTTIQDSIANYLTKDNVNKFFEKYNCKEEYNCFCNYFKSLVNAYNNITNFYQENSGKKNKLHLSYYHQEEDSYRINKKLFYQYFWNLQFSPEHHFYNPIKNENQIISTICSSLEPLNTSQLSSPAELDHIDLSFFHKKWITILPNRALISCKWDLIRILNEEACITKNQIWDAVIKLIITSSIYGRNPIEVYALIKFNPNNKNATLLWFYKDAPIGSEVINIENDHFLFTSSKNTSSKVHGFFGALFFSNPLEQYRPDWFGYHFFHEI